MSHWLAERKGSLWLSANVNKLSSMLISSLLNAVQEVTYYGNQLNLFSAMFLYNMFYYRMKNSTA